MKDGNLFEELRIRDIELRKKWTEGDLTKLTGKPSKDKPHLKFYPEYALQCKLPEDTLYGYLYECNKAHMDDIAIVFDPEVQGKKYTYKDLFIEIDAMACKLVELGVKPKDKVIVSTINTPESAIAIYAINKIGAVVCLVDPRLTVAALKKDLEELHAVAFIGAYESYKKIEAVEPKLLKKSIFLSLLNSSTSKKLKALYGAKNWVQGNIPIHSSKNYKSLTQNKHVEKYPYQKDTLALIAYTGGTTGVHKGVMLTNDALNSLVFIHDFLITCVGRQDVFMNILPQFMIYGAFTLHLSLCWGLKMYQILNPAPEKFVENLIKYNPAVVFGGPVHWERLINNATLPQDSLANLVAPISGGEHLTAAKAAMIDIALSKAGALESICDGFGASEMGGSSTLKYGHRNKAGSVGRIHVYDNAMIVNPDTGEELGYDEIGELYLTSPSMMLGYYNREEENQKVFFVDAEGTKWFRTGDLARIDTNGDIEITGRIKRLFVCGVNNVYPNEMEAIISQIENVKGCVITNVPDKDMHEVPKAHLILFVDSEAKRKTAINEVRKQIELQLGKDVVPRYFEFHESFPYTSNSKIDYISLRSDDWAKMRS